MMENYIALALFTLVLLGMGRFEQWCDGYEAKRARTKAYLPRRVG